jgi:hypothetical protein
MQNNQNALALRSEDINFPDEKNNFFTTCPSPAVTAAVVQPRRDFIQAFWQLIIQPV